MNEGSERYAQKVEAVFYTHNYLWAAAQNCLDRAALPPESQADYMLTHAFLGSFLAFEAFVNYVGEIIDPLTWKYLRRAPVERKLKWVCEKLELSIDSNSEPYRTWNDAREKRNYIAHGTVFRSEFEFPIEEAIDSVKYIRARWHEILNPSEVERIRTELSAFAESIRYNAHRKGYTREDDDMATPVLGKNGTGRLGYTSKSPVINTP